MSNRKHGRIVSRFEHPCSTSPLQQDAVGGGGQASPGGMGLAWRARAVGRHTKTRVQLQARDGSGPGIRPVPGITWDTRAWLGKPGSCPCRLPRRPGPLDPLLGTRHQTRLTAEIKVSQRKRDGPIMHREGTCQREDVNRD